jgi:hypothetical protein
LASPLQLHLFVVPAKARGIIQQRQNTLKNFDKQYEKFEQKNVSQRKSLLFETQK